MRVYVRAVLAATLAGGALAACDPAERAADAIDDANATTVAADLERTLDAELKDLRARLKSGPR